MERADDERQLLKLDSHRRTLAALALLSQEYGVPGDLDAVVCGNVWQPAAIVMLAECVAALAFELGAHLPRPGCLANSPKSDPLPLGHKG